ncbi:hypothetical protein BCV69DRAFT_300991 [Microstroma glucosiphilum]|uniref:BTB domain-containing protein n=1 Tax=Pseudomicrostroma glucosiphilum TaxID=1684307 RepID=A0A316U098_9BASI|nr:hypothetical protein BCV69DRAFT_300991 [Pseudomicrostroma glucosiphilum]PWN18839.1 hypothetical protein BCV69DRAFT_300991 [Pseudomicrostroma glucosiphilum]
MSAPPQSRSPDSTSASSRTATAAVVGPGSSPGASAPAALTSSSGQIQGPAAASSSEAHTSTSQSTSLPTSSALRRSLMSGSPASSSIYMSGIPSAPSPATASFSLGQRLSGTSTPTATRGASPLTNAASNGSRGGVRPRPPNPPVPSSSDAADEARMDRNPASGRNAISNNGVSIAPRNAFSPTSTSSAASAPQNGSYDGTTTSASSFASSAGFWRTPPTSPQPCRLPHCTHHGTTGHFHQRPAGPSHGTPRQHSSLYTSGPQMGNRSGGSPFQENALISFSWAITDLRLLRDEVESTPLAGDEGRSVSAGAGKSEVWASHPTFGDGKWKVELIRTARFEKVEDSRTNGKARAIEGDHFETEGVHVNVLSLFLTSMVVDYGSPIAAIPTNLLFGIRPWGSRRHGQLGAGQAQDFLWTHSTTFTFKYDSEFYHCSDLPSISTLLANDTIAKNDAIELVVQVGTGPHVSQQEFNQGSSEASEALPFHMPEGRFLPNSILDGLTSLVDCPFTGDLALVVPERGVVLTPCSDSADSQTHCELEVLPWPVGTSMPFSADDQSRVQVVVRDRVIWAHSAFLSTRSTYFKTMLASGFAEGRDERGGRFARAVRIDDVDYTTALCLIRYLYTGKIDFLREEDVRSVALDEDWLGSHQRAAQELTNSERLHHASSHLRRLPIWAWTSLDELQVEEGRCGADCSLAGHICSHAPRLAGGEQRRSVSTSSSHYQQVQSQPSPTQPGRAHQTPPASPPSMRSEASNSRRLPSLPFTHESPKANHASLLGSILSEDPHSHPAPTSQLSSSPLATYKLCHRYGQIDLCSLSKSELLSNLTQDSAFATLLATYYYADLQVEVEKFVLENAQGVLGSKEFKRCCDEVSAGEWGIDAGRTLRSLMRSMMASSSASAATSTPTLRGQGRS